MIERCHLRESGDPVLNEAPMNTTRRPFSDLDRKAVNTIRLLAVDAVEKANSGHPGLPLGAAPMAYVLWSRHLRHSANHAQWLDRDRFVLSPGHGSALIYSLLHVFGYGVSIDDMKSFRQWGSKTPGHPEFGHTSGIEATTGPLGQGTANVVGMAVAERMLSHRFNREDHTVVDHFTYAIVSDGDLMEGISHEAAALAGHWKLGKLIYLYDANDICLDGPTCMAFTDDVRTRYESCGWHVLQVNDGNNDLDALDDAITQAKLETGRPSLIIVKTIIAFGAPKKAGTSGAHGAPLGAEEVRGLKQALGVDPDRIFAVDDDVAAHFAAIRQEGEAAFVAWERKHAAYAKSEPDLARQLDDVMAGRLPAHWDAALPVWKSTEKPVATRTASGKILNAIAAAVPEFIGGDADLSCSTKTSITGGGSFDGVTGSGRNIHYGVREHAMTAIQNGIAYHGGVRAFTSTFFVFSDYMRPAVRVAALSKLPTIYVWTHDSVAVGEDGPTHQPVEHLMALRVMPGLTLLRPADANETRAAWRVAMQSTHPVGLVLSRQDLPILKTEADVDAGVTRGAYVVAPGDDGIIIATGSEVSVAMEARKLLAERGMHVRVVSMPSWDLFEAQDPAYHEIVLPSAITRRVSVEAGATFGWQRFVGAKGRMLGIDHFGASAPGEIVLLKFGFTAERVVSLLADN